MSNSPASNKTKFGLVALLAISASIGVFALWLPTLQQWRHNTASSLRQAKVGESSAIQTANFYASTLLEPRNYTAIMALADRQIELGDLKEAGKTLERLPGKMRTSKLAQVQLDRREYKLAIKTASDGLQKYGPSAELSRTKAKAEVESGDTKSAIISAKESLEANQTDIKAQTLYGLAALVAGEGSGSTTGLVTAPEALGRIARAQVDNLALAQELYSAGLSVSSKAILSRLPPYSTEVLKLKAMITLGSFNPSKASLAESADNLQVALKLNPADQSLWELMITARKALKDQPAAAEAQEHLLRLKAGRP